MGARRLRDTDADWRLIGETEPFWGVVSAPKFRQDVLDGDAEREFYASGDTYVAAVEADFRRFLNTRLEGRRVLDFGCGVGRLTRAMSSRGLEVTGYDISPAMLAIARSKGGPVLYVDTLPQERFGWINAYIVFQHIPPERGLPVLSELLERLEPGGIVSLHFTVWRDDRLRPPRPSLISRLRGYAPPRGAIQMYDYDLGAVVRRLQAAGVSNVSMSFTDHGGHGGVMVLAERPCRPEPARY